MSILIHFACFFRGNRRKPRVFLPFQGFSSFMPCFLRHTCTRRVVTFETEGEPELPGQCIASDAKIDQFLSSSFWKMGTTGPLDRYPQASSVSPGYFEWCEFLKAGVFGDVPSQPRHIQIIQGISTNSKGKASRAVQSRSGLSFQMTVPSGVAPAPFSVARPKGTTVPRVM